MTTTADDELAGNPPPPAPLQTFSNQEEMSAVYNQACSRAEEQKYLRDINGPSCGHRDHLRCGNGSMEPFQCVGDRCQKTLNCEAFRICGSCNTFSHIQNYNMEGDLEVADLENIPPLIPSEIKVLKTLRLKKAHFKNLYPTFRGLTLHEIVCRCTSRNISPDQADNLECGHPIGSRCDNNVETSQSGYRFPTSQPFLTFFCCNCFVTRTENAVVHLSCRESCFLCDKCVFKRRGSTGKALPSKKRKFGGGGGSGGGDGGGDGDGDGDGGDSGSGRGRGGRSGRGGGGHGRVNVQANNRAAALPVECEAGGNEVDISDEIDECNNDYMYDDDEGKDEDDGEDGDDDDDDDGGDGPENASGLPPLISSLLQIYGVPRARFDALVEETGSRRAAMATAMLEALGGAAETGRSSATGQHPALAEGDDGSADEDNDGEDETSYDETDDDDGDGDDDHGNGSKTMSDLPPLTSSMLDIYGVPRDYFDALVKETGGSRRAAMAKAMLEALGGATPTAPSEVADPLWAAAKNAAAIAAIDKEAGELGLSVGAVEAALAALTIDADGVSGDGVVAVTEHIFGSLERDYGSLFTRAALGFITWSVRGVSDVELEDLLSLDEAVLTAVRVECPGVTRLPSHVWLRLRGALQGLIVEHSGGCLQWYHHQLWEAAQRRYATEKIALQRLMGVYFGDLVDAAVVAEKQLLRQPLTHSGRWRRDAVLSNGRAVVVGGAVWTAPVSQLNERRAVEAGVHLVAAGMLKEAVDELCDLETVCLRFKVGVGIHIASWLVELQGALAFDDADGRMRVEHYRRWLIRDATTVQNDIKALLRTASAQPKSSVVRRAAEVTAVDGAAHATSDMASAPSSHFCSRILGGLDDFDAMVSVLVGHNDERGANFYSVVNSVSWSPDGTRLASGSSDWMVRVWDEARGALAKILKGHNHGVNAVSWSPDGSRLASGSGDKTVRVWDVATGASVATLEGHADTVNAVCWSPDGTRLASGSNDKTVRVWDAATWTLVATLEGHADTVNAVCWSPDGTRLASGSDSNKPSRTPFSDDSDDDSTVQSATHFASQPAPSQPAPSNTFVDPSSAFVPAASPTGPAVGPQPARIHRRKQVPVTYQLAPLSGPLYTPLVWTHLASRSDGESLMLSLSLDKERRAAGSDNTTLRVWDAATWTLAVSKVRHTENVRSLSWSPDGYRLATGSHELLIWDVTTGCIVLTLEGHTSGVFSVSWSHDGKRLASAARDTVRVWEVATGKKLATLAGHKNRVTSVSWSRDGTRLASGSGDQLVRVWDVATEAAAVTRTGHTDEVKSLCWSPDGTRLATGSLEALLVWNVATGALLATLEGKSMTSVSWSPDGTRLATGSHSAVLIWDVATGAVVTTLTGHTWVVYAVSWSPDGTRLASGSGDKTVRVWDVAKGASVATLEGHTDGVASVSWSPDGTRLASGSWDESIRVWDVATGAAVFQFMSERPGRIWSVSWSPDGTRLASGSDDYMVRVWDVETGTLATTLQGHTGRVFSVSWSPDGTRLASAGSHDKTVIVWGVANWEMVATLKGHIDDVNAVCWSPDGTQLASGSMDTTVRVWDMVVGADAEGLGLRVDAVEGALAALTVSPLKPIGAAAAARALASLAKHDGDTAVRK